ncbi:MAG: putative ABC transporter permease [Bacilli bacterium]|nr:putative ABC transporter permease [Bacilli bacterium]
MKKLLDKICDNYIIFCVYAFFGWLYEVLWFLIAQHKFVNRGVLFGPFLPIYGFGVLLLLVVLRNFMKKKHESNNIIYTSLSIFTILTFIYITIIEYTTPKIYELSVFFENYGLILISLNLLFIVVINYIIQKFKKFNKINLNVALVFLLIWVITTSLEFVSHFAIDKLTGNLLWDYSNDFLNINARVCFDASRNFAILGTILLYLVQPFIDKFLKKTSISKKRLICIIIGIPMTIDFIVNVIIK